MTNWINVGDGKGKFVMETMVCENCSCRYRGKFYSDDKFNAPVDICDKCYKEFDKSFSYIGLVSSYM